MTKLQYILMLGFFGGSCAAVGWWLTIAWQSTRRRDTNTTPHNGATR